MTTSTRAKSKVNMQLSTFFSLWTALIALLLSVFALADNRWPDEIDKVTFGKRPIAVSLYVLTIVASSVSLWESWKSMGGGGGGGGGYP